MGYKVLGFIVWRGARFYVGRKFPNAGRKLAVSGVVIAGLAAGAAAAASSRQHD